MAIFPFVMAVVGVAVEILSSHCIVQQSGSFAMTTTDLAASVKPNESLGGGEMVLFLCLMLFRSH